MRATERLTGFSHSTALPALDAASICSAWNGVGVAISTASTSFALMISSTEATFAPTSEARSAAALGSASAR